MTFLCCGDALFDLFVKDAGVPNRIGLEGHVGGSPLNVAIGLARLGEGSAYFTKISQDLFGGRILKAFAAEGVSTELCLRGPENSTLAIVEVDAAGVPRYAFHINGTADRSISAGELPAQIPDTVRCIHIGSYTTVTEPTGLSLTRLVERERLKRFISYDLNVRPSIEPRLEIWRERISRIAQAAHLVKASDEDLALLYPGRAHEDIMAEWLARGARLAIVTRGEKGALACTADGARAEAAGVSVTVADTVGAGDTFQAATLSWLRRHGKLTPEGAAGLSAAELTDLLGLAVRAAAVTCSRRGADLPRAADLGLPAA